MSEMLSSGGLLSAMSFEISPVVLFAAAAVELAALPNRPDIFEGREVKIEETEQQRNRTRNKGVSDL